MNQDNRLVEIFKIMSFYDKYRWENSEHYKLSKCYELMNLFQNNLDDDTKILTHWLCYITDRQMPFQRIWDVGGFVFSELIYEIKIQKKLNLLKPNPNDVNSFVQKEIVEKKERFYFVSKSKKNDNKKLKEYDEIDNNDKVKFKSRFLPSDYYTILSTFVILEEYDFSFSKFIKKVYDTHNDQDDFLRRILYSLYLLTYYGNKQFKSSDLNNYDVIIDLAKKRKVEVKNILGDSDKFEKEYKKFQKKEIFKQKRAWCSLRDYIKSPEIKDYFKKALSQEGLVQSDFDKLFSSTSLAQLELPGDVWNNNSKFRKCILDGTEYINSKWSLNKILRDFYKKNQENIDGYPEQFDISFDFVPRMCESDNCNWCPIYKINNAVNNFNNVCIKNTKMYCPIILAGCNYKCFCTEESECKLINAI